MERGNVPHENEGAELRDVNHTGNNGEDVFTCKKQINLFFFKRI